MAKYRVTFEANCTADTMKKVAKSFLSDRMGFKSVVVEEYVEDNDADVEEEFLDYISGKDDSIYSLTEKGEDLYCYISGENGGYWNEFDYDDDGNRICGSVSYYIAKFREAGETVDKNIVQLAKGLSKLGSYLEIIKTSRRVAKVLS